MATRSSGERSSWIDDRPSRMSPSILDSPPLHLPPIRCSSQNSDFAPRDLSWEFHSTEPRGASPLLLSEGLHPGISDASIPICRHPKSTATCAVCSGHSKVGHAPDAGTSSSPPAGEPSLLTRPWFAQGPPRNEDDQYPSSSDEPSPLHSPVRRPSPFRLHAADHNLHHPHPHSVKGSPKGLLDSPCLSHLSDISSNTQLTFESNAPRSPMISVPMDVFVRLVNESQGSPHTHEGSHHDHSSHPATPIPLPIMHSPASSHRGLHSPSPSLSFSHERELAQKAADTYTPPGACVVQQFSSSKSPICQITISAQAPPFEASSGEEAGSSRHSRRSGSRTSTPEHSTGSLHRRLSHEHLRIGMPSTRRTRSSSPNHLRRRAHHVLSPLRSSILERPSQLEWGRDIVETSTPPQRDVVSLAPSAIYEVPSSGSKDSDSPASQLAPLDWTKHPKYHFSDGSLLCRVGTMLYNLHRHFFDQHSIFFHRLFSSVSMGNDQPIVLYDVQTKDFDRFLTIFYPTHYTKPDLTTVDEWTSVLILATKWAFADIRTLAIEQLTTLASPIDKVVLGTKYEVHHWLVPAYKELCMRWRPLDAEESGRLGTERVAQIGLVRSELEAGMMREVEVEERIRAVFGVKLSVETLKSCLRPVNSRYFPKTTRLL
ncbi:unnamed protein product [Cyclocybe aegerita]|uniref:BTB domain-containing protein n=1 Tax=Cyclocybe aegerita TaxID=1973307 RepID=A0A8S0VTI3_CYCAE|nr:unnamed protein product [Cyclocybe aegerita]